MSAYITYPTPMTDLDCLLLALEDQGYSRHQVDVHEKAVPLVGYEGRGRPQTAHLVIRRQHVGGSSNDIGFEKTSTGIRAIISDYDQRRHGDAWIRKLRERYVFHDKAKQERLAREAAEAARLEAERRERERQALVEAQRQAVHEKAKRMGYRVKETTQGDRLRLVLVKRVYG